MAGGEVSGGLARPLGESAFMSLHGYGEYNLG